MMRKIDWMLDVDGNIIKKDDFVQLTEGKAPYINGALKKGFVFKVAYMEDRSSGGKEYDVAFLQPKTGMNSIYNSGVTSREIRKVNYDIKNKKIVE